MRRALTSICIYSVELLGRYHLYTYADTQAWHVLSKHCNRLWASCFVRVQMCLSASCYLFAVVDCLLQPILYGMDLSMLAATLNFGLYLQG